MHCRAMIRAAWAARFTMAPLPFVNAALFALQLVANAKQDAFSPSTAPNATPDLPIAPAPAAFLLWPVIYVFVAAHVFTDCFRRELSLYETTTAPTALRLCFAASCVLNVLWIALHNWLQWTHVATADLVLLAGALAPIYFALPKRLYDWHRYLASELAIRLYFAWVVVAALLCAAMSLQDLSGAYLAFETYALLLAALVVFATSGVVYGEDPVVGLVVTWALVGLAQRTDVTQDLALQHTAELLRACAKFAAPILPAMIIISKVHQHALQRQRAFETPPTDVEMAKPMASYQPSARYGAMQAP